MGSRIGSQTCSGNPGFAGIIDFMKPAMGGFGDGTVRPCAALHKALCSARHISGLDMVKTKLVILARLSLVFALCSCAAPKAIIVELVPARSTRRTAADSGFSEANLPPLPDDGIRLPDMLAMPGDGEFRATTPKGRTDAGAVIARPPTDPPSRPKPKEAGTE
jgi:hypothetical protein